MRLPLLIGLVAAAACGDGYLGRAVQVVYEPESASADLTLTGPIVTDRFPASVAESTHTDAQVFVIDLTDGAPTFRQLLGVMPAFDGGSLRVSAPFALPICEARAFGFVILDGVRDLHDDPIGRSQPFQDAFEAPGDFGPLRAALVAIGVELGSVAGATLFTSSAVCP